MYPEKDKTKTNNLSFLSTLLFVFKFYIKNDPLKLLWELLLNAAKQIIIVVTSVWLLKYLSGLILTGIKIYETIVPMLVVTLINISINITEKVYSNCFKPQSDLKLKTRFERIISDKAEHLPIKYYENSDFYKVVKQARDAVSVVFGAYNDIVIVVSQIASIISAVQIAVSIDPFLLVFVLLSIPMIMINKKIGKNIASKQMDMAFFDRKKEYAKELWLKKDFVREFKMSNASKIADKHFEEGHEGVLDLHDSYSKRLCPWAFMGSLFSITLITVFSYLYCILVFSFSESFDVSVVSVVVVAIMNMVSRIRKIYKSYGNICGYQVKLSALKTFLDYEQEDENTNGKIPEPFKSLEFKNVWFAYKNTDWVLKDVSFSVRAGDNISIVGYNGAGKTTLLKLILRFYDVNQGEILYNGINIKEYKLSSYRGFFAAAFQNYQVFSVKLAENIIMNEVNNGEDEKINSILVALGMNDLVEQKDRLLGREYDKEGIVLSGGQKQKIAVSRLDFLPFEIALLDEPSSALDPISSQKMIDHIRTITRCKTAIIISHDMAISKTASKILFFEEGKLIESGTHNSLMTADGKYADFFKTQARAFSSD